MFAAPGHQCRPWTAGGERRESVSTLASGGTYLAVQFIGTYSNSLMGWSDLGAITTGRSRPALGPPAEHGSFDAQGEDAGLAESTPGILYLKITKFHA